MPKDTLRRRRGRRPAGFCQEQTPVMTEQFSRMESNIFPVPYLSDKILEAVFHSQSVRTAAYLRVATAQDVRTQRLAILDALAKARFSGRKLGRPKGSLGVSRLNGKEDDIRRFLAAGRFQDRHRHSSWACPVLPSTASCGPEGSSPALSVYFRTNLVGTLRCTAS